MSETPVIILVNPQLGENIGFVARTMDNFGFKELRIVNPRDGWPNVAAEATAVKAVEIIKNAQVFESFGQAVSDLEYLYATSARSRDFNKIYVSTKDVRAEVGKLNLNPSRVGIIFGGERSGLDNNIISYVDKILYIPTNAESSSMNIAISVGVVCYELSDLKVNKDRVQKIASQEEVMLLFSHIENLMDETNFYKVAEKREKMFHNIRNIFKRTPDLTSAEVNTLIGIFKSTTK